MAEHGKVKGRSWFSDTKNLMDRAATLATDTVGAPLIPEKHWEAGPYGQVLGRSMTRALWIEQEKKKIEGGAHCFTERPPANSVRHLSALHYIARAQPYDNGRHPRLSPMSIRGPGSHTGSIVRVSTLPQKMTSLITAARLGNKLMHRYPFVTWTALGMSRKQRDGRITGSQEAIAYTGKTCPLCDAAGEYDLWHVLFECAATKDHKTVCEVKEYIQKSIPQLLAGIETAFRFNKHRRNTVSPLHIQLSPETSAAVRSCHATYNWHCIPGQWLTLCILLCIPFPMKVVTPPATGYVNEKPPRTRRAMRAAGLPERARNGEPRPSPPPISDPVLTLPTVPTQCFSLPEAVGLLFDETRLPPDALRKVANWWVRLSYRCLRKLGDVVRPLRNAAEAARLRARAADTAQGTIRELDDDASDHSWDESDGQSED